MESLGPRGTDLGARLARQQRFEDGAIAVVGVDVDVDDRQRRALLTEHVATVDGLQRRFRHSDRTETKKKVDRFLELP